MRKKRACRFSLARWDGTNAVSLPLGMMCLIVSPVLVELCRLPVTHASSLGCLSADALLGRHWSLTG